MQNNVFEVLKEQILNFDRKPGELLQRKELAAEFGVSLTPLRESLIQLQNEGLVEIYPQSKTLVSKIDTRTIKDAHFIRLSIEIELVKRLCEMNDPDLSEIEDVLKMQIALDDGETNMKLFSKLDRQFHQAIFEAADQRYSYDFVSKNISNLYRCQRLELPRKGKKREIITAHTAILKALKERDSQAAETAVRNHLSGTISRLPEFKSLHPAFFA